MDIFVFARRDLRLLMTRCSRYGSIYTHHLIGILSLSVPHMKPQVVPFVVPPINTAVSHRQQLCRTYPRADWLRVLTDD
jgi:hypothetical protein